MQYNTNIETIYKFYKKYPEYKGEILVNTRFGYKSIEECEITAKNEQVCEVKTKTKILRGSKKHLLYSKNSWIKIKDLNPKDLIATIDGDEEILDIKITSKYEDLYDLQVKDVREFYANGIVSHNSTIVELLYFTLFGTTIRELNKDLIVNSINKKHCETSLEFTVKTTVETSYYKLTRQIAPSKCSLGKKSKIDDEYEDITKSTIAKTTEFVQKLLNSTGKVFQNSVIMTINDTKPFMAQDKVEKRKFIENILNLEVFSVMLVKAREEYNELRRSYELLFTKKELLFKSHASTKQQLEMFEESKQKRIDDIEQKISSTKNNIESLNKTFSIIPDNVEILLKENELKYNEDINSLNEEYSQISNKVTEIKSEIRNVEYQIREVESQIREVESQIKDIEKVAFLLLVLLIAFCY